MDDDTLRTIGEVAARTALTVKTIRFYADRGIVAPTVFSPAGHRLYDTAAIARLELVRTLRALGMDLSTVRAVLDRDSSMAEVAATHADALEVEIRTLRVRRAVLRAVAVRDSRHREMELMHRLAALSAAERHRLIEDFVDDTFDRPDDTALRHWILERLDVADDPRVQRYWRLLGTVNAWPDQPDLAPIFTWFAQALRAHTA